MINTSVRLQSNPP